MINMSRYISHYWLLLLTLNKSTFVNDYFERSNLLDNLDWERERERNRQTEVERDRERQRQRERETERKSDRETETESASHCVVQRDGIIQ